MVMTRTDGHLVGCEAGEGGLVCTCPVERPRWPLAWAVLYYHQVADEHGVGSWTAWKAFKYAESVDYTRPEVPAWND